MTKDQLDAIRARFDSGLSLEYEQVDALLDEVERLMTLLAGTEAVLENEREYQTQLKAEVGQIASESFHRGAEAMREAAAQLVIREVEGWMQLGLSGDIRALPIPEDKP